MNAVRHDWRRLLIGGVTIAALLAAFFVDPIAQDPGYHEFADRRRYLGIPNFWNVATNLPFLVIGIAGLTLLPAVALRLHYAVFCIGVALVAVGSGRYHLEPSTAALVFDRLPMTIAFMALFAAVIADRVSMPLGRALLWPLVALGIASIGWWHTTEQAGRGDLRPYALVQFLPMLLIPLMLILFRGERLRAGWLWAGLGAYLGAKLMEHFDAGLYSAGQLLSGHSLKHLLAALAAWWIALAFRSMTTRKQGGVMDIASLVIQLISGAVGGNVAGAALKKLSLGTVGNSIVGIIGGGLGGQLLGMLGVGGAEAAAGSMDAGSILTSIAGGGAGGGVLLAIVGAIRQAMGGKKSP